MSNERFDVIIVGSGFGGSVMAYRMSLAGLKVCLLERGRAYPPGSFPRSPEGLRKSFWDPSEGLFGLMNVHLSKRLTALTASGLGGGSLIYAAVLMRKDSAGFKGWPLSLGDLEPHYARVEKMLPIERYPVEHIPYSATAKTLAMKDAARELGYRWEAAPLGIRFSGERGEPRLGDHVLESHPNLHDSHRSTCRLCGECNFGCNSGSKESLDFNYLSEARRLGADIRTLCEVRSLRPNPRGGYQVCYLKYDESHAGHRNAVGRMPLEEISAKTLVLSAGSLNTTYLLLNHRNRFPKLSPRLGHAFNGNGDVLAFSGATRRRVNPSVGPVITSSIIGDRMQVQDTAYPEFLNWLVEGVNGPSWLRRLSLITLSRFVPRTPKGSKTNFSSALADFLTSAQAPHQRLPLCSMGDEPAAGRLHLSHRGKMELEWNPKETASHYDPLRKMIARIAATWGAKTMDLHTLLPGKMSTVHPLGGCPMGNDSSEGVVNPWGEVFGYPDLFIADGSVVPGAIGVNPALTIAALADRTADEILRQRGLL